MKGVDMQSEVGANSLPEPLKNALWSFCHVQCVVVLELRDLIKEGRIGYDVKLLEAQMDQLLDTRDIPVEEINQLTSNEFESIDEAAIWLTHIRNVVFRGMPWV
ncbi:hypothetical protein [Stenotrophomonas sp.]|uniref:hypothetical protein n=1 Tax=Stenotrophomonas sp. TaxID=69392 RepID=UPI0028A1EBDF|nr:hypothetical protein [Stenotrophomonas sp.]